MPPSSVTAKERPSNATGTETITTLFASYTLIVAGLAETTCPMSIPVGPGVGVRLGVRVAVIAGVDDAAGVDAIVGVAVIGGNQ